MSRGDVLVLPAFGQSHLFPCLELCHLIASRHYKTTLFVFPNLYPSIPKAFHDHPLLDVVQVPISPSTQHVPSDPDSVHKLHLCLETFLSARSTSPSRSICAVVDVLVVVGWTKDVFKKYDVPTVGFFTSGACSAAMEHATWKAQPSLGVKPGELFLLPGLPEDMGLTGWDLKRRPAVPRSGRGLPPGLRKAGSPVPGDEPNWVNETEDSIALMVNTCDELEGVFFEYLAREVKKPVWGVGPLFPAQYWRSPMALVHDSELRINKWADVQEAAVVQWLDSKPRSSVMYVAFGSSVDLTMEDYPQLASALESSAHPFIWVLRENAGLGRDSPPQAEGYYPRGMEERVGSRGLIIRGWAPQLMILSHVSTGGFLSHCGWNSTMEALARGVPMLTWPLRGDQYYDAKLAVCHLKVGYTVVDDFSKLVKKDDIVAKMDKLMGDKEMKKRAEAIGARFEVGFPASSIAALDAFVGFINPGL